MIFRGLFLFFLVTATLCAFPAHASSLSYDAAITERQKILIHDFFAKTLKQPAEGLAIARADLNEDGLVEFIIRSGCGDTKASFCDFRALAESGDGLVELAEIKARKIELGNSYSGGIRNIIAFKDVINDFEGSVYIWDPETSRYIIKE